MLRYVNLISDKLKELMFENVLENVLAGFSHPGWESAIKIEGI